MRAMRLRLRTSMRLRVLVLGVVTCGLLTVALPAVGWAQPSEHPFELVPGSFSFTTLGSQAAAHSDWVTSFDLAHEEPSGKTYNDLRDRRPRKGPCAVSARQPGRAGQSRTHTGRRRPQKICFPRL
jgi:hypothetical protein